MPAVSLTLCYEGEDLLGRPSLSEKTTVLDKALIEKAFTIMGRELLDRKRFAEICIYGGSALIFLFDWRKVSGDVDAIIRSGEHHQAVIDARDRAAKELGLEKSWLNEQVTQYVASRDREHVSEIGIYPSYERPALRVLSAKPDYILALKVMAMGERSAPDDRDFMDAAGVAAELGLSTADEIREKVGLYFPGTPIPMVTELRLDELAEAAQAHSRGIP